MELPGQLKVVGAGAELDLLAVSPQDAEPVGPTLQPDQGALAARNMLGADMAYDTVPWFWSDQYDQTLQIAGLPIEGRNSVNRDLGDGAQLYFHLADDGRLVGASGVGPISKVAKNIRLAEMLIQRRLKPDAAALADASIGLKSLLKN